MNPKIKIRYFQIVLTMLIFSCSGELEDCYDTVCAGPDGTDCQKVPNFNSSCFPTNNEFIEETNLKP